MSDVKPIPDGHPAVIPHLVIRGAAQAVDFYVAAFGAEEVARMPLPDGGILHAELRIGTGRIFLCDESPMMERWVSPKSLNGTSIALNLWTDDAEALFAQGVKAGAKVVMPLSDMFWGDRYGRLTDPFGHEWAIAQHVRDVPPEEMAKAAAEMFADTDASS